MCTSASVEEDKSAYWTAILYFQYANGTYESVDVGTVSIYYLPGDHDTVETFPDNLRMLVGDPAGTTLDTAINQTCLDYAGAMSPDFYGWPTSSSDCPDGVRINMLFPRCARPARVSDDAAAGTARRSRAPRMTSSV